MREVESGPAPTDPAGTSLTLHGVMKAPCKSCPYRRDVPSGVWSAEEYDKLPGYDGEIVDQIQAEAWGLFLCHQQDGCLCSGWLACHGTDNLLALRMHGDKVKDEVWSYETDVPVFASGREACDHGKAEIEEPGRRAGRMIERLCEKASVRSSTMPLERKRGRATVQHHTSAQRRTTDA